MPALWLIWRARWYGVRNVPDTGPVILISNHQSHFDPILVGTPISLRCPRFLARESLKADSRFWGWFIGHAFDSIWLKQGKSDPGAMRAALNELKNGRVSVIFPEGSRTPDGSFKELKRGAYLLIKRGMATAVPVAIEGAYDAWPSSRPKPRMRGRIKTMYGEPIPAEELIAMGPDAALAHIHDIIEGMRLQLRQMIRKESRGRLPRPGAGDADGRESGGPDVAT
jgi:1-acyl-sn-glycerol-3-phosphate acyltransferase